ncbi:MAG TPA: hypothetical protein VNU46_08275 [Gemmatimonadaceae bacterium]|jgi:hypothetical protein|nr:hypothetical protein [Gemmatimonadaceae bacterium]
MVTRRGTSSLGCLVQIALAAGLIYCGIHIGQPYYRYYAFKDSIDQQVRFAASRSDDAIRKDILANVDSLSIPDKARDVQIDRTDHQMHISTWYDDSWTIWHYTRWIHFVIDVKRPL